MRGVRPNDLSGKAGEIAGVLEERLVRGEYHFGQMLSTYTLAEEFSASRQPVTSAVLYLRTVGYLEVTPQVGCRVVSPAPSEVQDFYVLFSQTEAVIACLAAERHSADEGEELMTLAGELSANPFQSLRDRRAMADGISIFHDQISMMARSPLLVDRISNLRRIFRFYLRQNGVRPDPACGPPARMNRLRIELAESIRERSGDKVRKATGNYILNDLEDWARVV